jgi:Homing endonuclease associated repeat/Resolvase, N terminal domain/Recombinase/Recombinase zinc beta ribbon domain
MPASSVPCVIYAAKSTEDRRGSIPDQLVDCRAAIDRESGRIILAEYTDEAFSAFKRSRGPGLVDALRHAEEVAKEDGSAELWAQHSDRLARGDGKTARHAVEIALWALKCDVRVRTVQDPDTFRDLLYAVVTGQRNHEDSRRKGLAVAAGRKRAAERGNPLNIRPDGYKLHVEVDKDGEIRKRTAIDPDRRVVIELIFRLALRGRRPPAIARAVNRAGWLTKPSTRRGRVPQTWRAKGVVQVLMNPVYAGLSTWKGEIVARGCWPAYISERQHARIRAALAPQRGSSSAPRQFDTFLLSRLAVCGRCGSPLHALTKHKRVDGTFQRRYSCLSHRMGCNADRCTLSPVPAAMINTLFVSALPALLVEGLREADGPLAESEVQPAATMDLASERQRLIDVVLAGDDLQIDAALERIFTQLSPEAASARQSAISHRRARERDATRSFQAWAEQEKQDGRAESRTEARKLNRLLRTWFSSVTVDWDEANIEITAKRRAAVGEFSPETVVVRFDRVEQARLNDQPHRTGTPWADAEIIAALQAWAETHGRTPRSKDWEKADGHHPVIVTVTHRYGSWSRALQRAGLKPSKPQQRHGWPWTDGEIFAAMTNWAAEHGKPPTGADWAGAAPEHPSSETVRRHFGSWQAGLAAARLTS